MGPQLTSAVTSVLLVIVTNAATWAAARGIIQGGDVAPMVNGGVPILLYVIAGGVGWYKTRQARPEALIAAVNDGQNGVKVVPATAPGPTIWKPLEGPGSEVAPTPKP